MKSGKVPVPSQVQERVLPEARCDDTAVPRVPDSAHTAPPARRPAVSGDPALDALVTAVCCPQDTGIRCCILGAGLWQAW